MAELPRPARRGVFAGEVGMLLAIVGTLLRYEVVDYQLIMIAFLVGSAAGVPLAYLMPMTAVPQRTALSHAFGALAAALVGTAEYYKGETHGFIMVALVVEMLLGYLTFTGQPDGLRQTAGDPAHAAHHVPQPELHQPLAVRPRGGVRRRADLPPRMDRRCSRSSSGSRCCSACC